MGPQRVAARRGDAGSRTRTRRDGYSAVPNRISNRGVREA